MKISVGIQRKRDEIGVRKTDFYVHGNEHSVSIIGGEFLDRMKNC
jgi:hypothetical protein